MNKYSHTHCAIKFQGFLQNFAVLSLKVLSCISPIFLLSCATEDLEIWNQAFAQEFGPAFSQEVAENNALAQRLEGNSHSASATYGSNGYSGSYSDSDGETISGDISSIEVSDVGSSETSGYDSGSGSNTSSAPPASSGSLRDRGCYICRRADTSGPDPNCPACFGTGTAVRPIQ